MKISKKNPLGVATPSWGETDDLTVQYILVFICFLKFLTVDLHRVIHPPYRNPYSADPLTRYANIREHSFLAVLDTADLRKVDIQCQVEKAAEESKDSHGDAIVAGILVAVEDAILFLFI